MIHFQIGHSNDGRLSCTIRIEPAKDGAHAGHKFAKTNRLGYVVIGACLQCAHHIVFRVSHRDHQDPNFGRKGTNFATRLHSADSRHVDVKQNEIKRALGKEVNCLFSTAGLLDHKTAGSERSAKHFP